jgi:hypothetical protein
VVACHKILVPYRPRTLPPTGAISVVANARVRADPCTGDDQHPTPIVDELSKGIQFGFPLSIWGCLVVHFRSLGCALVVFKI